MDNLKYHKGYIVISIIIPAYNEQKTISECIYETLKVMNSLEINFEIIVVDDGSSDATWECIKKLYNDNSGYLRAIRFNRNYGKESAIVAGLRASRGKAAIIMDADMQHPPTLIPKMVEKWENENFQIVEAIKENSQDKSLIYRVGRLIFYHIFHKTTHLDLRQSTDFKLLDKKIIEQYLSLPEKNKFFRGLIALFGYSKSTISFIPPSRLTGTSRWSTKKLFYFARNSIISFTSFPLKLLTWIGFFGLFSSILIALQTLWNKLQGEAVEGFTTVILIQLAIGSSLMIGLGLIGEYLSAIYEEIKKRPIYTISDKLDKKISQRGKNVGKE